MGYVLVVFLTILGTLWFWFGILFAGVDFSNEEFTTPIDFYEDGYNWVASWVCFILRFLIAFPFYVIGIIIHYACEFFGWLVRIGRE